MSMHNGMCGHIGPGSVDFKEDTTLSDYINRKSKNDALANAKPKMTFEEWWSQYAPKYFSLDDADSIKCFMEDAWYNGQGNK